MLEQISRELSARRAEFQQIKEKASSIRTQITQLLTEINWLNNPQEDSLKLTKGILFRIKENQLVGNDFGYTMLKSIPRGSENYPPLIEELIVNFLGTCERVLELQREISNLKSSALFIKVRPRTQEDLRKIDFTKPLIINLFDWPANEELVLDLRNRNNFIMFYQDSYGRNNKRVRLLNSPFNPKMIANLTDSVQEFVNAWKEKKIPSFEHSQTRVVYNSKIIMTGNVTSSSASSPRQITSGE